MEQVVESHAGVEVVLLGEGRQREYVVRVNGAVLRREGGSTKQDLLAADSFARGVAAGLGLAGGAR